MARLRLKCRDVRTREAGIQDIHHRVRPRDVELIRRDYAGSRGWETFLSYEDPQQDILIGLLRLRRLQGPDADRQPGLSGAAMLVTNPACCSHCFEVHDSMRTRGSNCIHSVATLFVKHIGHSCAACPLMSPTP